MRILVVEDDALLAESLFRALQQQGYRVDQARRGHDADNALRNRQYDLLLLDIGLPDIEGFEVARALAVTGPPPWVVLTSSRDARAYGRRLTNGHALGFIPKERISGPAIRARVDHP